MKYLSVFTLLLSVFLLMSPASCAQKIHESRLQEIESALDDIRAAYVPDKRIAVFNLLRDQDNPKRVIVETNVLEAVSAVEELLFLTPAWQENIEIRTLPDIGLEGKIRARVSVSVAYLRKTPKDDAELIDQAIMGTQLKVLKQQGDWYLIQVPWQYLGWVTAESITLFTEDE